MPKINRLLQFSTADLVAELALRNRERRIFKPQRWCDECVHFTAWRDEPDEDDDFSHSTMPKDYNPCSKDHTMRFYMPRDINEEFGYHLPNCKHYLSP